MSIVVASSGLDVFSPETIAGYVSTAIVTIVGLIVTVWLLKILLYKPILKMIHARQKHVEHMLDDAQQHEKLAKEHLQQMETKLGLANEEAKTLIKTAKQQSVEQQDELISTAKKQARIIVEQAELDRKRMMEADEIRIQKEAVTLATQAIGHLFVEGATEEQKESMKQMIQAYLKEDQLHKSNES